MKKYFFLLLFVLLLNGFSAFAQVRDGNLSPDKLWQETDDSGLQQKSIQRSIVPKNYRTFELNKTALNDLLGKSPMEFTDAARNTQLIMTLPMPDGTFARFSIEESPIMEPELAARFPEIKTYRGQGIDDPTATARFDFMPSGFHSMILSSSGTVLVDPYAKGDTDNYISYFKRDAVKGEGFVCHFGETISDDFYKSNYDFASTISSPAVISGSNLRTYRLALAATGEYTAAVGGGTVSGATQAQASIMNRVNGIYERDLAIRMVLVANNHLLIYTNSGTDPYTNNNGSAMLGQNQTNLTNVIGSANYDIGHVFSTGGGGIATLQSPCSNSTKARGVTGLSNPVGDNFAVDYVAHEMGHQFGGNHTFNANDSQRASSAAYEPGSGITIMGYAGIVAGQNLAAHSIDTFHVRNLEEIISFKENGGSCGAGTATGNTAPTVTAPTLLTIPRLTPFALTASATDINGDSITYDWQEYDLGPATSAVPNTDSDGIPRPIFRPYLPTTGGTRFFPSLTYILNNANVPPSTVGGFLTGELLPTITRTMMFQVVARDNRANAGGINTATTSVVVDGNSGPFVITAPNSSVTWNGNSTQNITWSVANTATLPVNAANVQILFSTDGGQTFQTILVNSTPNDGSETITVPNTSTTTARIKVEAIDNIFFDISDVNFTVNQVTAAPSYEADVSARPNGDGSILSDDVVQIRRFLNGTNAADQTTNEFQRADSSPFVDRGDGRIFSDDVVQARRYQNGTNTKQLASGPMTQAPPRPAEMVDQLFGGLSKTVIDSALLGNPREVRVENAMGSAGQNVTVNIRVNAVGNESEYGFIVNYDSTILSNPVVGAGTAGASVRSCNIATIGQVNCSVGGFPTNNPMSSEPGIGEIAAGTNQLLITVQFTIAANAQPGTTPLTLSNVNASSDAPQLLFPAATNGTVTILAPTAASSQISGRVVITDGRAVSKARVTLTDQNGEVRSVLTSVFGYYHFDDIAAGETYVITVQHKRYVFVPQVINVTENINELIITAQP